jgi:hypothetical protein
MESHRPQQVIFLTGSKHQELWPLPGLPEGDYLVNPGTSNLRSVKWVEISGLIFICVGPRVCGLTLILEPAVLGFAEKQRLPEWSHCSPSIQYSRASSIPNNDSVLQPHCQC